MIDRAFVDRLADIVLARGRRFVYWRCRIEGGRLRSSATQVWNPRGGLVP
jgi:hypothetical protein